MILTGKEAKKWQLKAIVFFILSIPVVSSFAQYEQTAVEALPEDAGAMSMSLAPGAQRDEFFGELDHQLTGLEHALNALSQPHSYPHHLTSQAPLADISPVVWHLNQTFRAPVASEARKFARQVLVGALSRRGLRAEAVGTLRYVARGGERPVEETLVADRLEKITRRLEAADPTEEMFHKLAALREHLFGSAQPEDARLIAGKRLDELFEATPSLAEGAPVYQEPGAIQDEFGRTNGFDDVSPRPAGSPRSFAEILARPRQINTIKGSPRDWRDESFYYVMVDRFGRASYQGSDGIARPIAWGDPYDARTRHGGNLRGLIEHLDYLKDIATTIVLSPIVQNPRAAYHGYSSIDRLRLEDSFGTMEDLKALGRELESRGMWLIVDRVFNHTGHIFEYEGGYSFGKPHEIKRVLYPDFGPVEYLREPKKHFNLRGDLSNWNSTVQKQRGDLPGGIHRLKTESPETRQRLIQEQQYWMEKTRERGVRLDAYPHIADEFWGPFYEETHNYAASLGIENYLFLGELFEGDPKHYIPELKAGRLGAAYNYVAYYWNDAALHGRAPTRILEESYHRLLAELGGAAHYLVNFLGNHDRLHFLGPEDPEGVLHFALAHNYLTIGMPYLYGEEQAPRRVPGRRWLDIEAAREDRFEGGKFTNPAFAQHSFDTQSSGYRLVSKLASLRRQYAPLRRGEQYVRWSDPHGPGIYAFSRILNNEEILVVLNSSNERQHAQMWVDARITPPGTTLVDAMDNMTATAAFPMNGGSQVRVEVPPYGVRVFVRHAGP